MAARLLALCLCLHAASACVPVRPGEDMPCPSVPQAAMADGYNVKPLVKKPNENGAMVYGCNVPDMMLSVTGTTPTVLPEAEAKILCKPNSGIFVDTKDMAVGAKTYACGTMKLPCQTCDMSKILDVSNGACATQGLMFCKDKPTVTPGADMCPTVACTNINPLFLLTTATASTIVADATKVICDAGTWKNNGVALAGTEIGFVCGLGAFCEDACDGKVEGAFTPTADVAMFSDMFQPNNMRPTCQYKCPTNKDYALLINGMGATHSSIMCEYEAPNKVTADGQELAANDKFSCVECTCTDGELNTGLGICDAASEVCVAPKPGGKCQATCPPGSTTTYALPSGQPQTSTNTFSCVGATWIDPAMDAGKGVTCSFPQTTNFPSTPDPATNCAALPPHMCANPTDCDASQVVYVPSGNGAIAMCKQGDLKTNNMNLISSTTCDGGVWLVTEATCDTSGAPTSACITMLAMIPAANLEGSCKFGVCTLKCKTAGERFHYTINGGTARASPSLLCIDNNDPAGPGGVLIDNPGTVTCMQ